MKNRICIYPIALNYFFGGNLHVLLSPFGQPTEVSMQFNLWLLRTTRKSVWPPNGPTQVQLVASWDHLRVQSFRVVVIYFVDFLRFQQHQSLAQSVKGSRYYQTIPPVQVECPLLDGDPTSIPIIFEDKYYFSEPREPGTCKPLCCGDFMPKFCKSR